MPVRDKPSKQTANTDLLQRLVDEWKGEGKQEPFPDIIQEKDDAGDVVHVYVIWDEWRDLGQTERSEIITDAYWQAFGEKGLALTVAMGLTSEEGKRMKLTS